MSFFPNLPLRTARLVLRPPEMGDAEALLAMHADPEVMRYWATPPWHAVDQAVDRIEKDRASLLDGSAIRLLLQPTDGGPVLGAATLFAFVPECGRAEVGYILSREAWGLGLMQEALGALLHYGGRRARAAPRRGRHRPEECAFGDDPRAARVHPRGIPSRALGRRWRDLRYRSLRLARPGIHPA